MSASPSASYLLAAQPNERERLQLQSQVWEPAGRRLLAEIDAPEDARAVDLGCGCLGWLRLLSQWVGPDGLVIGTDVDRALLDHAADFCRDEDLSNVSTVVDDLFASRLPTAGFDLVHARFQIAPLGRADDVLQTMLRLVRPGGVLILEDPCSASWQFHPGAPAAQRLVQLIVDAFDRSGGCFDAGPTNVEMLRERGLSPRVRAEVLVLAPDDPYLRLPLQFARSLRDRLCEQIGSDDLDELLHGVEAELADAHTWGLTFTLVQAVVRVPADNVDSEVSG